MNGPSVKSKMEAKIFVPNIEKVVQFKERAPQRLWGHSE
jgi:hypothetical protein